MRVKKKVFIWGASGHALFVMNIISLHQNLELIGLIDDINPENKGSEVNGYKVLGGKEMLPYLRDQGVLSCVLGFGNCSERIRKAELLLDFGLDILSIYHPDCSVASSATIGKGVVIGPNVVVDANCIIENNCILNNSCCISHGSYIGEGAHICPGVVIGGDVTVGKRSWIGIGSSVIQKVIIGTGTYIGAGSLVTKNIPDNVLSYGVPARIIKNIDYEF